MCSWVLGSQEELLRRVCGGSNASVLWAAESALESKERARAGETTQHVGWHRARMVEGKWEIQSLTFGPSAHTARTQGGHNDGSGAFAVSSRTGHRNNGNAATLRRAPIPRPGLG